MLSKAVIAFIEKVNSDASLHGKVAGEPQMDVVVGIARENGFQFTGEEWVNTVKALYSGELSDEDLANIAGGSCDQGQLPINLGNLLPGANASYPFLIKKSG
jgi:predicted ribosomally synthesized peptide with nif11-like leader